ncbi:MAG: carbohydrate kinase [Treponema sp.]|jgi:fructokinase|nr:carbohydrate kinase [Treponema sp.]
MPKFSVTAYGAVISDFTCSGSSPEGYPVYVQNPGGGAANVAAAVARLGGNAAIVGKIGKDSLSTALRETMSREKVNIDGLVSDSSRQTMLAFVSTDPGGERSFSFYGHNAADLAMAKSDLNKNILEDTAVFSHDSRCISTPKAKNGTLTAIKIAAKAGAKIAFDVNIRLQLWNHPEKTRDTILSHIPLCNYLKLSKEELLYLLPGKNTDSVARGLLDKGAEMVFVTNGKKGAAAYVSDFCVSHPAYPVNTVDATGAGDAFWGSMLLQLADIDCSVPSKRDLKKMLAFSCACGSLATVSPGAVPAMPSREAVVKLMSV